MDKPGEYHEISPFNLAKTSFTASLSSPTVAVLKTVTSVMHDHIQKVHA